MTSDRRIYAALGTFLAGDAVASAIPIRYVVRQMDTIGVPPGIRWVIPVIKAVLAAGLLSVFVRPALARATAGVLAGYFAVAVALRIRARDNLANIAPSTGLLAAFAALAASRPATAGGPAAAGSR